MRSGRRIPFATAARYHLCQWTFTIAGVVWYVHYVA